MRTFLAFTLALAGTPLPAAEVSDRPNFVVIMAEAQGWACSSVQMDDAVPESKDPRVHTPNLEKLAAAGLRFADFYAASPRCTPTRAALFTGKSPAVLHMTFVGQGRGGRESGFSSTGSKVIPAAYTSEMPESETTIAELLKSAGYATAHFGKWHVGRGSPAKHGFDESDGPTNNGGPDNVENPNPKEAFGMTERGMDFMARETQAGRPFYLQVSHYAARGPGAARPETLKAVRSRLKTGVNPREASTLAAREDMDSTIGMLLAKIDELGIADRTYILYTADHGAQGSRANGPVSNGKGTVWEGGVRVPLIVRGPGIEGSPCTHVRASTVDLFPTIAALAGVKEPLPEGLEGGNLEDVLMGTKDVPPTRAREELVVHSPHYDKDPQGPASALWLGNDKLIHPYETDAARLFDLAHDPGEQHDLAGENREKAADLDKRLKDYLLEVKASMTEMNPDYDSKQAKP